MQKINPIKKSDPYNLHYEKYNWDPGDPGEQLRDFKFCSHFIPESS